MLQPTRLSLIAFLVLGAACQPRSKAETATASSGSEAAAAGLSDKDKERVRGGDAEGAPAAQAGEGSAIDALYTADAVLLPPGEPMVKGVAAKRYWVDFANGFSGPTELN